MRAQLAMLAAYNAWANRRLYAAVAPLPDADYRAERGAFFGSLHGTLNHLLVGDRIWLARLTGSGDAPTRLDAILYQDFAALRAARAVEDERLEAYVGRLGEDDLAGTVRYRTISSPATIEQQLVPLLLHVFNHQTHHRGQAHCLLTGLAGAAPSLDLLIFQRETGAGIVSGASLPPERRPGA
ncbi:MAG: DinB family protein [Dongiaceae bacterium]